MTTIKAVIRLEGLMVAAGAHQEYVRGRCDFLSSRGGILLGPDLLSLAFVESELLRLHRSLFSLRIGGSFNRRDLLGV